MTTVNPPSGSPSPLDKLLASARRLMQAGQFVEAAGAYQKLLSLRPDIAELQSEMGNVLTCQRKFAEAQAHYERAVALRPNFAPAYHNLANLLRVQGRLEEALVRYEQVAALMPGSPDAHNNVGNVLAMLSRYDEATRRYERALALRPQFAEAHNNLANVLKQQDQFDRAIHEYQQVLALQPDYADAHNNLGNVLRHQGKIDEAMALFNRAIEIQPDFAQAHYDRTALKTFRADDPELATLEALAADPNRRDDNKMVYIHFGLGKALEDAGQYDRAFQQWIKGNALQRKMIHYDEPAELQNFTLACRSFPAKLSEQFPDAGDPSATPIFILGMPRSGTTLIEQILASHPLVYGAGELAALGQVACAVTNTARQIIPFPLYLQSLKAEGLRRMGQAYLAKLPPLPEGKTRLTDKMPANFLYIGLIRLILPNAKIIHTVRDPADTCLSCFSRLFTVGQGYSYELGELGRYYRHYHELMDHWRAVLPAGSILDVRYEDVVDRLEEQARRLLDFCGLPWDPACLEFHKTKRLITTASDIQVRQPLYRSSVVRWRHYQRHLGPLLAELKGLVPQE